MKQPGSLLKLAAVVSSVLLVGGFVSYRAGAFNSLMGTGERPADDGAASQQPAPGTAGQEPAIMWGPKSAPAVTNITPDPTPSDHLETPRQAPVIMSGSKSLSPSTPIQGLTPAKEPPANSEPPKPSP